MPVRDAPIPDALPLPSPLGVGRRWFWAGVTVGMALGVLAAAIVGAFAGSRGRPAGKVFALDPPTTPVVSTVPVLDATDCDVSRALASAVAASPGTPVRFRVALLRVVDGDTIRVRWHGDDFAVRLVGIDAPEVGQPGFREAADALAALLADAEAVHLTFPANRPRRDSFGRLLATVWADATDCNAALLASGHARPYVHPRRRP